MASKASAGPERFVACNLPSALTGPRFRPRPLTSRSLTSSLLPFTDYVLKRGSPSLVLRLLCTTIVPPWSLRRTSPTLRGRKRASSTDSRTPVNDNPYSAAALRSPSHEFRPTALLYRLSLPRISRHTVKALVWVWARHDAPRVENGLSETLLARSGRYSDTCAGLIDDVNVPLQRRNLGAAALRSV